MILLAFIFILIDPDIKASAQAYTPYDIINEVNALRASRGLAPYQVDPWLMAWAQEHSEYQASTGISTHLHKDGTVPSTIGVHENVASGTAGFVTPNIIIYEIWADPVHMKTMVGYTTGLIGVGVATSGDMTYCTLDVKEGTDSVTVTPRLDTTTTPGAATPSTVSPTVTATTLPAIPVTPLGATSTPEKDGSIVHVVGYGQTLWSIASIYGVTTDEIRQLNNLTEGATLIKPGQKLVIRQPLQSFQQTPSPAEEEETDQPPATHTPTLTAIPLLPTGTKTALQQATDAPAAVFDQSNNFFFAVGLITFCVIGLVIVLATAFRKK
jgi:LysM repeat protein